MKSEEPMKVLMLLQTKINDHLEIMSENMLYAVSEFNLESWWNDIEYVISVLAASEEA
tara:strand:+ start:260 stop:433 length:174 start_codon:yes stop_codon:yes gene_type:complete